MICASGDKSEFFLKRKSPKARDKARFPDKDVIVEYAVNNPHTIHPIILNIPTRF
jgi:hypothetical protein